MQQIRIALTFVFQIALSLKALRIVDLAVTCTHRSYRLADSSRLSIVSCGQSHLRLIVINLLALEHWFVILLVNNERSSLGLLWNVQVSNEAAVLFIVTALFHLIYIMRVYRFRPVWNWSLFPRLETNRDRRAIY